MAYKLKKPAFRRNGRIDKRWKVYDVGYTEVWSKTGLKRMKKGHGSQTKLMKYQK
jgi:hypothetical protein